LKNSHLNFTIFQYPEEKASPPNWKGNGKAGILVLIPASETLAEDEAFLINILKAAQLTPLEEQVYLLICSPHQRLALAQVCRHHQIHTVLLFGGQLTLLGIQATLPWYHFVRVGELTLLRAHPLKTIREERTQGKNEKAGALWKALKAKYL
jgi:hypothetical protein